MSTYTYTLIKTDSNFILANDEDLKDGELFLYGKSEIMTAQNGINVHDNSTHFKIIASLNKIEGLPTLTFDEVVAQEIGYVDIDMKAIFCAYSTSHVDSFRKGYLQAIEDNKDKVYSITMLRLFFGAGCGYTPDKGTMEEAFDSFMNKVQLPTQWQVEIEMEHFSKPEDGHSAVHKDTRPKITNNSIRITKII